MNTPSNKTNLSARERWEKIQSQRTEEEVIEMDAQMLRFQFLSEIQKYQEVQGLNRKTLAERIATSASYLTQLWRGDKPLNFLTLAKMQRALGISFKIKAEPETEEFVIDNDDLFFENIRKYHAKDGFWIYRRRPHIGKDIYSEELPIPQSLINSNSNESKALTA